MDCASMMKEVQTPHFHTLFHNASISVLKLYFFSVKLGNYHSSVAAVVNNDTSAQEDEQHTIRSILDQGKTTTTIGKVNNDNLSRLLTEYLGMDNMLALVCKTYDGVKGLEKYDKDDIIDKTSGIHGLGRSVGKFVDGRFIVFCLENLRPFSSDVIIDDPQRKLILHRPRLPGGESPPGFLDFVVNMIHLDRAHLRFLIASGHGLRETLFSHLQVYKTRTNIQSSLPLIKDGVVSLDGGLLRPNGSFCLGHSKNLEVKFAVTTDVSSLLENVVEMEEQVKRKNWEKEMV
ncbi:Protein DEFECTIVE IN MERISTEM SILENCING 3 [Zea mays]|uniref:Protein DEFECTIVE IN MERISTEM SILENCING 3 n=1 Tax=Zea mays TaxID=4577 RepID=A0A1D6GK69_MAIZE|nr:Protein DEFECTIVE IN MERISTEM SILENCING 3 [Zea mays]